MLRYLFLFFSFAFFYGCFEKPVEKITEFHPNNQKKTSFWVKQNGVIRKQATWYSNGIQEYEIPYKDSVPHGEFVRWDVHGNIIAKGKYHKGHLHGEVKTFFIDKRNHSISYYKNGLKENTWEEFYFSGGKRFEKHFSKDSAVGLWKYWHPNGELQEETSCFSTNKNGYRKIYAENGKPIEEYQCSYGQKNGESKTYYPGGGLKTKEVYSNGKLEGERLIYFAYGNIQKKEYWKNGNRHSHWISFSSSQDTLGVYSFENGNGWAKGFCFFENKWLHCSDTLFVDNKIDSVLTRTDFEKKMLYEETWNKDTLLAQKIYYLKPEKQLASTGYFKKGKPHGTWLNFYPNGQIKDSLNYKEGERFGHQKKYDEKGMLILHTEEAGKHSPVLFHTSQDP